MAEPCLPHHQSLHPNLGACLTVRHPGRSTTTATLQAPAPQLWDPQASPPSSGRVPRGSDGGPRGSDGSPLGHAFSSLDALKCHLDAWKRGAGQDIPSSPRMLAATPRQSLLPAHQHCGGDLATHQVDTASGVRRFPESLPTVVGLKRPADSAATGAAPRRKWGRALEKQPEAPLLVPHVVPQTSSQGAATWHHSPAIWGMVPSLAAPHGNSAMGRTQSDTSMLRSWLWTEIGAEQGKLAGAAEPLSILLTDPGAANWCQGVNTPGHLSLGKSASANALIAPAILDNIVSTSWSNLRTVPQSGNARTTPLASANSPTPSATCTHALPQLSSSPALTGWSAPSVKALREMSRADRPPLLDADVELAGVSHQNVFTPLCLLGAPSGGPHASAMALVVPCQGHSITKVMGAPCSSERNRGDIRGATYVEAEDTALGGSGQETEVSESSSHVDLELKL